MDHSLLAGRIVAVLTKALLALMIAAGCGRNGGGDVTGAEPPIGGTIRVIVMSGGSPLTAAATIRMVGPVEWIMTVESGAALLTDLPPGIYTVVASVHSYICPSVNANLSAGETTTARITCEQPGNIAGRVINEDEDSAVEHGFLTLNSDAAVSGTTSDHDGGFTFDNLLPGRYRLSTRVSGMDCPLQYVDVYSAETTQVLVRCVLPPPSPSEIPRGSQINGPWWYYRTLERQTGNCPRPLPDIGTGTMSFDPGDRTISIVGLDPSVRIVGTYDTDRGTFTGLGRGVRGDGSTVQTELTVGFFFNWWGYGGTTDPTMFSTRPSRGMLRTHQDAAGMVTCIEAYQSSGDR